MASDYKYLFKTVIVGDSGVGKTSLLLRYTDDTYTDNHIATIGVDFKIRTLDMGHDDTVKMQIWDTAGQDRFRSIVSTFYRGAHGVIVVYDVTDPESFQHVRQWFKEAREYGCTIYLKTLLLIGNKSDLTAKRVVSFETAQALANELGVPYLETSAKDTTNVEQTFTLMAQSMLDTCKANKDTLKKDSTERIKVSIGKARGISADTKWALCSC